MRREEEAQSIYASFSDFCSVGQRFQGNKEQLLLRENSRLRREHSEISEKYIKMCNDMAKMQGRVIEKQRKITELELFYRKEIEELKKQLQGKNNQLARALKFKNKVKGEHNQKQNISENCDKMSVSTENQSLVVHHLLSQNTRLHQMIEKFLKLFQTYARSKQNSEVFKRIAQMRKELQEKVNMECTLEKGNNFLEEARSNGWEKEGELGQLLVVLKNKKNQLKKVPLTFDYDLEAESKDLEVLLTDLDIQMRLTRPKCEKPDSSDIQ